MVRFPGVQGIPGHAVSSPPDTMLVPIGGPRGLSRRFLFLVRWASASSWGFGMAVAGHAAAGLSCLLWVVMRCCPHRVRRGGAIEVV